MASSIGDRLSSVHFGGMNGGSSIGRKIRLMLGLIVGLVIALFLLPSTVTYVNPGYVGIVIHRAGFTTYTVALPSSTSAFDRVSRISVDSAQTVITFLFASESTAS